MFSDCTGGVTLWLSFTLYQIVALHLLRWFALPVYDDTMEKIARHNIYSASMLVRHANNGQKYLYDILAIKKETSSPLE